MKKTMNGTGAQTPQKEQNLEEYQKHVEEELKKRCLPYTSPTPGMITIIAQSPIPGDRTLTKPPQNSTEPDRSIDETKRQEIFEQLTECGFNTVLWGGGELGGPELDTFLKDMESLKDRESSKLAVILEPQWLDGKDGLWEDKYDYYDKKYSVINGWDIRDEPNYRQLFYNNSQDSRMYNYLVQKEEESGKRRPVYFNLAATPDPGYIGERTGCYKGFLQLIEMQYRPSMWSFDFYPFSARDTDSAGNKLDWKSEWMGIPREDGPVYGSIFPSAANVEIHYNSFFYNLATFARRSLRTGRPFWAYCMCVAHKIGKNLLASDQNKWEIDRYLPAPSPGMLRFEAFGALAFGAQGIAYWMYGAGSDSDGMIFREAPLMNDLKTSSVWYNCQAVNSEIAAFNDVFLDCRFVKAAIVNGQGFAKEFDGVPNISALSLAENDPFAQATFTPAEGSAVLITHIVKDRYPCIVCVNLDPFATRPVTVHMRHTQGYLFRQFSSGRIRETIVNLWNSSNDETRSFNLAPGGIIAIRVAWLSPRDLP